MAQPSPGFGLGLRTPHYADFLAAKQPLDWLEIITDNFLVEGGKPLVMLDRIRCDYPMAMHGVAMSIGAADGVELDYLRKVKALADRIQPLWVSDHLCWMGPGPEQLHDLYPMPYTDEAARHVVAQIQRAQDVLQRQLVLENVSSYIDFKHNAASEWQFLAHIAQQADCLLLVDVNNIYVSSVNHGFDPLDYLNALPAHRVQQMHLAGHSDCGDYIVDTHDHPVVPAVWDLYAEACKRFGPVATMIERDDDIPPLQTLIDELHVARRIAEPLWNLLADANEARSTDEVSDARSVMASMLVTPQTPALPQVQRSIADYILDKPFARLDAAGSSVAGLVRERAGVDSAQRLGIYHNAYRVRLADVLADSFAKTCLYMGSDTFAEHATAFAVAHPPLARSLSRYGADLPAYLAHLYPDNPELHELAQLDWDLRTRFDSADVDALDAQTAQANTDEGQDPDWLGWQSPLHPSLVLRSIRTNVVQLWRAIDADAEVPPVQQWAEARFLAVWRKGLQPHFQSLDADEAAFLHCLQDGQSVDQAATAMAGTAALPDPQRLGGWLQAWLNDGVLRLQEA
nr:DUF692 family multinuclear iron-containing protein [uncultured Rhodoferax sp.]